MLVSPERQALIDFSEPLFVAGDGLVVLKSDTKDYKSLEERYGRRSTMITSQLPVDRSHEIIGDPTYADAILDRLVHNAYRIELAGESMRRNRGKQNQKAVNKRGSVTPQM